MRISRTILLTLLLFVSTTICVFAYSESGRYGGADHASIDYSWSTGNTINGGYTTGMASNRSDSPAYMKRVYVRAGEDGSYSEWVTSGRQSIEHTDYGPYNTSLYDARFYWDYD